MQAPMRVLAMIVVGLSLLLFKVLVRILDKKFDHQDISVGDTVYDKLYMEDGVILNVIKSNTIDIFTDKERSYTIRYSDDSVKIRKQSDIKLIK